MNRRTLLTGSLALGATALLPSLPAQAGDFAPNREVVMTIHPVTFGEERHCNFTWVGPRGGWDFPIIRAHYFYNHESLRPVHTVEAWEWETARGNYRIPTVSSLIAEEKMRAYMMIERPEAILPHKIVIEY